jgi:MFS family permease
LAANNSHSPRHAGFGGAIAVMRIAAYRDFMIANSFSLTGTWLQRIATGWLVWQLTESPAWLGILAFVDLATIIAVSPVAGAVADRVNRQHMMVAAQLLMMSQAIALAALYGFGLATIWVLLTLQILQSVGQGIHTASRMALVPSLVPKDLLAPAIGINAMIYNVARFLGPALAGLVISQWGQLPAFILNALSFVPFTFVIMRLKIVAPDETRKPHGGMLSQISEGMRYAARHPGIGPMMFIMGVTAFAVRALPDMLPGFSADVFGRGVDGLAWLTSAMGLGAVGGALVLARTNGTAGLTRRLTWNVGLMSFAVLGFVATDDFSVAVAAAVVCGYVLVTNGATSQTLIQSTVDGAMRGRVMSSFTLLYLGMPALGGLAFGHLAEQIGLRAAFALGAGLCFFAFLWMMQRKAAMATALEIAPNDSGGSGGSAA